MCYALRLCLDDNLRNICANVFLNKSTLLRNPMAQPLRHHQVQLADGHSCKLFGAAAGWIGRDEIMKAHLQKLEATLHSVNCISLPQSLFMQVLSVMLISLIYGVQVPPQTATNWFAARVLSISSHTCALQASKLARVPCGRQLESAA